MYPNNLKQIHVVTREIQIKCKVAVLPSNINHFIKISDLL